MNVPEHHDKPFGFLGLPAEFRDPATARIGILPVPYDATSTWQKGADKGPQALIDASAAVELYDIATGTEAYRHGIATLDPIVFDGSPEELARRVDDAFSALLDRNVFPVMLGGEHSVSIGAFSAMKRRYPNLSILQMDAHGDTRESYEGSTHNHACVMARAREMAPIVQVGIRAIDESETEKMSRRRVFFAHEIVDNPDRSWMERVIDLLTDDVYITIDLDAFDPSLLPATGTPEPGGLSWYEVDRLLQKVAETRNVIGFDVVELMPIPGQRASDFAAAKLTYRLLSLIFADRDLPGGSST